MDLLDEATQKPIQASYHFSFADIDGGQTVALPTDFADSIQEAYVTSDSVVKTARTAHGTLLYYSDTNSNVDNAPDHRGTLTFGVKNSSGFDFGIAPNKSQFDNLVNWPTIKNDYKVQEAVISNNIQGCWGIQAAPDAVAPIAEPQPNLTTTNKNEKQSTTGNLKSLSENFQYNVTQTVPYKETKQYYDSYQLNVELPEGVIMDSTKVLNENGQDVSNKFSKEVTGSTVKMVANSLTTSWYSKDFALKNLKISSVPQLNYKDVIGQQNNLTQLNTDANIKISSNVNTDVSWNVFAKLGQFN